MNWGQRVKSYANYKLHAKTHQRMHSPFVFDLLSNVFYQPTPDTDTIQKIEERRQALRHTKDTVHVTDLGAGSWKTSERTISDIAKKSLKRKEYAQLIYRITNYFSPKITIELGTSLGITTSYISQGYRDGQVVTIEGCPNVSKIAQETFDFIRCKNIIRQVGNFDDVLPAILKTHSHPDMIFIDGNHNYEATIKYFNLFLKHTQDDAIFIFDDIHWSEGMEKAWREIKQHPKVKISIDIYEMGFIFLRNENHEASHFTIKYP